MPKMKPDRDDSRGGLGAAGPQDGPIDADANEARHNQKGDLLDTGGMGQGEIGQGGQRHPGGSSRD